MLGAADTARGIFRHGSSTETIAFNTNGSDIGPSFSSCESIPVFNPDAEKNLDEGTHEHIIAVDNSFKTGQK